MHLTAEPSVDMDHHLLVMAPTVVVDLPHLIMDTTSFLLKIHLDLLAMSTHYVVK